MSSRPFQSSSILPADHSLAYRADWSANKCRSFRETSKRKPTRFADWMVVIGPAMLPSPSVDQHAGSSSPNHSLSLPCPRNRYPLLHPHRRPNRSHRTPLLHPHRLSQITIPQTIPLHSPKEPLRDLPSPPRPTPCPRWSSTSVTSPSTSSPTSTSLEKAMCRLIY